MAPAHFHCDRMQKQQAVVMWIIWFAFLQTAFAYHFCVDDGFPEGDNAAEPMASVASGRSASCRLSSRRWCVGGMIPKVKGSQADVAHAAGNGHWPRAWPEASIFLELFLIGCRLPAKSDRGVDARGVRPDPVRADLCHPGGGCVES